MFGNIIANQATIIGNQATIIENQKRLAVLVEQGIENQKRILDNQHAIATRLETIAANTYGSIREAQFDAAIVAHGNG